MTTKINSAQTPLDTAEKLNSAIDDINELKNNTATLTLKKNGETLDTFSTNTNTDKTIDIQVPTKTSEIENDSDFVLSSSLSAGSNNYPVYFYEGKIRYCRPAFYSYAPEPNIKNWVKLSGDVILGPNPSTQYSMIKPVGNISITIDTTFFDKGGFMEEYFTGMDNSEFYGKSGETWALQFSDSYREALNNGRAFFKQCLMIDLREAVYTVTFATPITWESGSAPNMTSKALYLIDIMTFDGESWMGKYQGKYALPLPEDS